MLLEGNTFVLFTRIQEFQNSILQHSSHELFFHEMRSIIYGKSISEVFPPCTDAHNSASSVMIMSAEEGVEGIDAAI